MGLKESPAVTFLSSTDESEVNLMPLRLKEDVSPAPISFGLIAYSIGTVDTGVFVAVGLGVTGVFVGTAVFVGVGVLVLPGIGVLVAVGLEVLVAVAVATGVLVGVAVGVPGPGVFVGLEVEVTVGELVAVFVAPPVWVGLDVLVAVKPAGGVLVGVAVGKPPIALSAAS